MDKKNQRKFFDELGKKLKIRKHKDWGRISRKIVAANGGNTLLTHYYGNSILKALREIYPGSLKKIIFLFPKTFRGSESGLSIFLSIHLHIGSP